MSNYDETYGVIYEVIMRKFQDLDGVLLGLEIQCEVRRVSCACIQ